MADHFLGSEPRPLRVAIVGSGPSAFYAADALQKSDLQVRIDMFDRLPTPFGLVRGGVAPDHQNIKAVVKSYERTAAHPAYRFFGNVMLGRDLSVADLVAHYDQIVYAVGNESDRKLGLPGEDLRGVHSATAFVGWYNGHPDYRAERFDLAGARTVAVIGNGNVAIDVARVLIKQADELVATDIAEHALAELRRSGVREVLLLGRRGPAQAAFSPKEIEEVAKVDGADLVVSADDLELDPVSARWMETAPASAARNLEVLRARVPHGEGEQERKVRAMFCVAPVALWGEGGRVTGMRLEHAELVADADGTPRPRGTGRHTDLRVDLVFAAIGYRGVPIAGVPFDERAGIIPNVEGRVVTGPRSEALLERHYVVGWAKRGPSGLIGTNNADSKATVAKMLEDARALTAEALPPDDREALPTLLRGRGIDFVTFDDWKRIDAHEQAEGRRLGSVRRKLTTIDEMLRVVRVRG